MIMSVLRSKLKQLTTKHEVFLCVCFWLMRSIKQVIINQYVCANYVHTKQTANTLTCVVACLFVSYTHNKSYYVD